LESGVINEEQAEQQTQAVRKEAFEKNKKMQQAQAAISFASGLVAMWANAMTLPFPVNFIVGGSQSAILTATYLAQSASIKKQKFAEGGHVRGAGSGTSDSIDAKLSHGEFVQKTKAVDYYGVPFMKALNNMQIPRMFAEGGLVTPMPLSNQSSQIAQSLSESITNVQRQDLRVINVEQDFSKMQNRVNNVERARTY